MLRRIEPRLTRRGVAAFIIEPISINLGVLIPEKDIVQRLRELCRRYGTLFIADEVANGFGRTGRLFARTKSALAALTLLTTWTDDPTAESLGGEGGTQAPPRLARGSSS